MNCWAEQAPGDGKTRFTVRSTLGERAFASTIYSQIDAVGTADQQLYYAADNALWKLSEGGSISGLGSIAAGRNVVLRGLLTNLCAAGNGKYFVWDQTTLAEITGGAFSSIGSLEFSDYDIILTEMDGKRFEWTETADPKTRNALNFATAEARDGNILRAIANSSQLYLLCEEHTEVWRNTGLSGENRYARMTVIDMGLKGYHLVTGTEFGVAFIGIDDAVYMTSGNGIDQISTPAVNTDIRDGSPVAISYYRDLGHKFCVIHFSDRPAWVYDLTTQVWHRRQTGVLTAPWATRRIVFCYDKWLGFDDSGNIREMARTNSDVGYPLKRVLRGKPITLDGDKFSVGEFEVICEKGQGANVMLRCSWDGGLTWTDEMAESLGGVGDYGYRARFPALGRGVEFTPEISCADPIDVAFYSDARIKLK